MISTRRVLQSAVIAGATLTVALAGASTTGVFGQTSLPPSARMFGGITVNGANGRSGAVVTAYSGTTLCGTSVGNGLYNGTLYYVDIDSSQSACSAGGTTITFKVDGVAATVTNGPATVPPVSNAVRADLVVSGTTPPPTSGGQTVNYSTGWNLVGVPGGTVLSQASNPLYTFPAGATDYTQVQNTAGLQAGAGYWAYYTAPTSVTLSGSVSLPFTVTVPAGQFVMVGNPSPSQAVQVSGPSDLVLYTYTTAGGYVQTSQLNPGQGGWAFSSTGGSVSMR